MVGADGERVGRATGFPAGDSANAQDVCRPNRQIPVASLVKEPATRRVCVMPRPATAVTIRTVVLGAWDRSSLALSSDPQAGLWTRTNLVLSRGPWRGLADAAGPARIAHPRATTPRRQPPTQRRRLPHRDHPNAHAPPARDSSLEKQPKAKANAKPSATSNATSSTPSTTP
jgi:hypothetical protein